MIQDIYPHQFHNEFRSEARPRADSLVLCFRGKELLIRKITADPDFHETGAETRLHDHAAVPESCKAVADTGGKKDDGKLQFPVFSQLPCLKDANQSLVYAFSLDSQEYFLNIRDVIEKTADCPEGYEYVEIFRLRGAADHVSCMIAFTGFHLSEWYQSSRFCGRCGSRTIPDPEERAMLCPSCGKKIYPRLNPAVIVGVTDGDSLLVTKYRAGFNHFALVAGFTEIGETLEETVVREVYEETGLKVKNIRYYKSQPWGIAQDILAGFYCDVDGNSQIRMDENELKLAQWRRREEIVLQPDSLSLTNEMMKRFRDGQEPGASNPSYSYYFFDLDGTLTDPGIGITNSVMYALSKQQIHVSDRSELYKFIGPPLKDAFMEFYGFSEEQALKAVNHYRDYFRRKGMLENQVYDGILQVLKRLKQEGKMLVLATSKPEEFSVAILKHFGLYEYFDFVAAATTDGSRSKKQDVIAFAIESLNITDLSSIIMIGDRKEDMIGARANHIAAAGVLYGYGDEPELRGAGADYLVEKPEDLLRIEKLR